ncbi:MAG TPA: CPBP family intramembrane metalloprotease [Phycisphaerae bacterium]|nr:CPBP family intramembrane metalloprotease [Phycisphaerae bacterium]
MMSNALFPGAVLRPVFHFLTGAAATTASATQAELPPWLPAHEMYWPLAVGLCAMGVWIIRRLVRPEKLSLADTPGRGNTLTPAHVLVLLAMKVLADSLAASLPDPRFQAIALAGGQVFWVALALLVARQTFRFGLRRGMGFSARHWPYDTGRGIFGYFASLPAVIALAAAGSWLLYQYDPALLEEKTHRLIRLLGQLHGPWKAVLFVGAAVLAPLAEEVFFRGILQSMMRRYTRSPWAAVAIASVVFGLLHMDTPQYIPALIVLGIVLGYNYERSGRLLGPIVLHVMFNGVQLAVQLAHGG